MKTKIQILLLAATMLAIALPSLPAQLVADGTTNTVNNVTNTITGTVTVGTNDAFTLLVLSDNALLTNSAHGVIGRNATAQSNEVQLISASARWLMGNNLFVGSNGAGNRLVVSNGAFVNNNNGFLGNGSASSNNIVIVTGTNSSWSNNSLLVVGESGSGNQLVARAGALVKAGAGYIGLNAGASNNLVFVTGAGSLFTNTGGLNIGAGNQLVISNGGQVLGYEGYTGGSGTNALITGADSLWSNQFDTLMFGTDGRLRIENGGRVADRSGSIGVNSLNDGNEAVVTGAGSIWTNRESLLVGQNGNLNRLVISNGGWTVSSSGWVGANAVATINTAIVTGADSVWSNKLNLFVGDLGSRNRMEVHNGGRVVSSNTYVGLFGGGNVALVTGSGSLWSNRADLIVGSLGSANQFVASNGATVSIGAHGIFGGSGGANSNYVLVTDPGTRLSGGVNLALPNTALYVGSNGSFNVMVVSNGASVDCNTAYVGNNFGGGIGFNVGSNNLVVITGTGSVWNTRANFLVGDVTTGNRLIITNGGVLDCEGLAYVGAFGGTNEAIVTGPGSLWRSKLRHAVGDSGANRLIITNGGMVINSGVEVIVGFTGIPSIPSRNRLLVDGGFLYATNADANCELEVRSGTNGLNAGLIEADQLVMGSTNGFFEFNGGTLVTRGAIISNGVPFTVGRGSSATPATWDVRAGPGSYQLANRLIVGSNSSFNQVFITNGAVLNSSDYAFLAFTSGSNNSLVVSGPGSAFHSPFGFFVGADGNANQMRISNGGQAFANTGSAGTFIGRSTGTRSNVVVVADTGSRWSVNDAIHVGAGGNANHLVISNGATVDSLSGSVGNATAGSNNLTTIIGLNSSWSNRSELYVGAGGSGNQLWVVDGGTLINSNAYLGLNSTSRSNSVVATGTGSLWRSVTDLFVGFDGTDNKLVVSNGAIVSVGSRLLLGFNAVTASNNRVLVDGGTLRVTNASASAVFEVRRGTNVINAGFVEVDVLRITNTLGRLELNGGTLSAKGSRINNSVGLQIGNGVSPATFVLAGNGYHFFDTVIVFANGTLTGNGTIGLPSANASAVLDGGTLSPGASIGRMVFTNNLLLFGTVLMDISKNGAALTNDQVHALGGLSYGGDLTVTNIGPTPLSNGDKFTLFAPPGTSAFLSLTLPPLAPGLFWTNKLSLDGSIEVFAPPAISMSSGSYTQSFDSLSMSGGSNPWRDNSTLLGWYAAKTAAPVNITNYIASDGNSTAGALYSFGSTGSPERALGSIGSGGVGTISYGLGFFNDTGVTVSNFNLTFTGEQWRDSSSFNTNTLTFWYRVSPMPITNPEPGVSTNWTAVTDLNFASPVVLGGGVPLDGNASSNRQRFSSVLLNGLLVPPGQNVFFRWQDNDDPGADEGIAVDDLVVSFAPLAPMFTAATLTTNGFSLLFGQGESNLTYRIEAATNMNAPISWQMIGSNTANGIGLFQFTDTNAPAFPMRFYRARFP